MRASTAQGIAATAKAEMKRRRDHLLTLVHHLDALIEAATDTLLRLDIAVLRLQRDEVQELADRISVQMRSRSWLYFGLLQAAENAGLFLGYTSPPERKPEGAGVDCLSPPKPKPRGPGIDYLISAAAQYGHVIGADRAHALLVEFNALPRVGAKLGGTGELKAHARRLRKGQLIDQ